MPSRPVVLFVSSLTPPAGASIGGMCIASRQLMAGAGDDVTWRLVDTTIPVPLPPWIPRLWMAATRVGAVLRELLLRRIDAVLVFTPYSSVRLLDKLAICLLGRLFRKQVVLSIRSEITRFPRRAWFHEGIVRMTVKSAHAVICQTTHARETLAAMTGEHARLVLIPNGINAVEFAAAAAAPRNRAASDELVILFMGRVDVFKGVFVLADALARLQAADRPFRLRIAGGGLSVDDLAARFRELGIADRVDFLGNVGGAEKITEFTHAHVFVLPSESEGMPNAILEAMASRLPVVATRVGGIPALITDQEGGYLVPPHDPAALAEALAKIQDDPQRANAMGDANLARIHADFDIGRVWPRVFALLTTTNVSRTALPSGLCADRTSSARSSGCPE